MMNTFFTFLFDIKRISVADMIRTLYSLIKSLEYFKNSYELIVFTNIDIPIVHPTLKVVQCDMNSIKPYYESVWHNLSFHKLVIAKTFTEKGISPIWIDLDTIVCRNVDHLQTYKNFFVKQGSIDETPFKIIDTLIVPHKEYIQGNIWKINSELVTYCMDVWDSLPTKPDYDTQGLFNYIYHFKGMNREMLILGEDVDHTTINGLDITNDKKIIHPTISLLKDNLVMRDNKIISLNSNKDVQFFSFTFLTLVHFYRTHSFQQFTDPSIRSFFRDCGYL